jgi:hypothetical protein
VVRNVVLAKLKPGVSDRDLDSMLAAMRSIKTPGLLSITVGRDLGLRDGNWDVAVIADLADEESYRKYDADAEHNRIRREVVAPLVEAMVRCQFDA